MKLSPTPLSSPVPALDPSPVPGQPALFEPTTRTLVLADLHYGHEVELLRGGVWVPSRAGERTRRVLALLRETGAERLVLNGDLKHLIPFGHRRERSELSNLFVALKRERVALEVVPGNHDGNLYGQLPPGTVQHPAEGCVISPGEWSRKALGRPHAGDVETLILSDEKYLKDKGPHRQRQAQRDNEAHIRAQKNPIAGSEKGPTPLGSHLQAVCDAVEQGHGPTDHGLGLAHGHAWPSAEVMAQPVVAMGHNHPAVLLPAGLPDEHHHLPCWVRAPFNDTARERYPQAYGELWLMPAFVEKVGRPVNRSGSTGMGPLLANGFIDWDGATVTTLEGIELGTIAELRQALDEARRGGEL